MYQSKYPHYQIAGPHRENLAKKGIFLRTAQQYTNSFGFPKPASSLLGLHLETWSWQYFEYQVGYPAGEAWVGREMVVGRDCSPLQCTFLLGHRVTSPAITIGTAHWAVHYLAAG